MSRLPTAHCATPQLQKHTISNTFCSTNDESNPSFMRHTLFPLALLLLFSTCQKIDVEGDEPQDDAPTSQGGTSTDSDSDADSDTDIYSDTVTTTGNGNSSNTTYPQSSTIIDGHIVISRTTTDNDTLLTFISLTEWSNVASAYHETRSDEAYTLATQYIEGNLSGWRIPTLDDAKALKDIYDTTPTEDGSMPDDTLAQINNILVAAGGAPLTAWQAKDSYPAYRYLCQDATYTFSLKGNTNRTKAGAKTFYNLRLLKDSVITTK